jgi:hypothetical protein
MKKKYSTSLPLTVEHPDKHHAPERWTAEKEWNDHEEFYEWYITSRDPKFVSLRVYTDTPEETARKICDILNREMP